MPRAGRGAKSDHPADIHEFHQECAKPFLDRELLSSSQVLRASLMAQLPANVAAAGSIHGSGRSPREGNGNPLQDSCLRNPTDRGAWRATVHGVAKSWTRLKRQSTHIPPGYRLSLGMGYRSCCSRIMRQGLPSSRAPGCLQQNYFINSLSITSLVASRYRICLPMQETEF